MTATLPKRALGPFSVSAIGLGCMNLSHGYQPRPEAEAAERLLLHALDRGVTFFDTAALYGFGANETLIGGALGANARLARSMENAVSTVRRRRSRRHWMKH